MPDTSIKSSFHTTKFANTGKLESLNVLLTEYRRCAGLVVDEIWNNGYKWTVDGVEHEFNIHKNLLNMPCFIDSNKFELDTFLSARMLSMLTLQVCGMIKSSVKKQGNRLYTLKNKKSEGTARCRLKQLIKKIKTNIPQKPRTDNLLMEISSSCSEFIEREDGEFDGFIDLKCINTTRGSHILIPIKFNRHSNELKDKSLRRLNSFLIGTDTISIRWEIPVPEKKTEGEIVGGDQGMKTVLTLANMSGTVMKTPEVDIHGHSLESIMNKMSRKRKGSRAFKRAQDHRKNFVNWTLNQLDMSNIKQLNLEKIWNLGFKSSKSRKMSHWTNTIIAEKVEKLCNENGVRLVEEGSTYMSQRCSVCGLVRKANRKGKIYTCKSCGFIGDADENAARNHTCELPEIPWTIRKLNMNRGKGFYWSSSGIYDLTGGSIESPLPATKVESY